jgi:hypothetical protein
VLFSAYLLLDYKKRLDSDFEKFDFTFNKWHEKLTHSINDSQQRINDTYIKMLSELDTLKNDIVRLKLEISDQVQLLIIKNAETKDMSHEAINEVRFANRLLDEKSKTLESIRQELKGLYGRVIILEDNKTFDENVIKDYKRHFEKVAEILKIQREEIKKLKGG